MEEKCKTGVFTLILAMGREISVEWVISHLFWPGSATKVYNRRFRTYLGHGAGDKCRMGDFALILTEKWKRSVKLAFPHLFWP